MSRVLVTRAASRSGALVSALEAYGIEAVIVPTIAVESASTAGVLDRVAASLARYRWVVVTSANGSRAILAAAERVHTALSASRWAALGPATADVLEREGIAVDFRPRRPDARHMGEGLPIRHGDVVLVLRGDRAGPVVAETLRARGAEVDDVVAYRTRTAPSASRSLLRRAMTESVPDAVILTSGSTVDGLIALAARIAVDVTAIPAVCIGPDTRHAAMAAGFHVAATAATPDARALAAVTADILAPRPTAMPR